MVILDLLSRDTFDDTNIEEIANSEFPIEKFLLAAEVATQEFSQLPENLQTLAIEEAASIIMSGKDLSELIEEAAYLDSFDLDDPLVREAKRREGPLLGAVYQWHKELQKEFPDSNIDEPLALKLQTELVRRRLNLKTAQSGVTFNSWYKETALVMCFKIIEAVQKNL